jgi:lysophospholipase L1-like esterase
MSLLFVTAMAQAAVMNLGNIMPLGDSITAGYQKVAARNNPHISVVDMYSLMNIHHQTNELGQPIFADISHPNQLGYNLMGDAWAGAVKSAVSTPSHLR